MSAIPKKPLIAIVGATGTGKSQLAIDLAKRFNGEIINADAVQLYTGLPVITNKVTEEEQAGIPHHLLGTIGLEEQTWTVGTFVKNAVQCVDGIHSRGRLPIVVGGTHYYTQALLLKDGIVGEEGKEDGSPKDQSFLTDDELAEAYPILQQDTATILQRLREVDPVMADRWHPKDRRRIQRSLAIFLRTGKTASATYTEQHAARSMDSSSAGGGFSGALRWPALVLWLHCDNEVLRTRLDGRVEKMLHRGLLDEVAELNAFRSAHVESGGSIDQTRGIWVSIGYKEFQNYQDAIVVELSSERDLERLKQQAIEATQAATRQYAKRQIRWVRIKLLNALRTYNAKDSVYLLDGTELDRWEDDVLEPSRLLVAAFLEGSVLPEPASMSPAAKENLTPTREDMSHGVGLWQRRECEACNAVFVTEISWETHVRSKGHRYHLKRVQLEKERSTANAQATVTEA